VTTHFLLFLCDRANNFEESIHFRFNQKIDINQGAVI